MTTFLEPVTRSIAPPIPGTILPGTIWLARFPFSSTCNAPRTVISTCPPRIIANENALSKYEAPRKTVTFCPPELIRYLLASPSPARGPIPRIPFSD